MNEVGSPIDGMGGFSSADIAGAIAKLREHPEIISAVAGALSGGGTSVSPQKTENPTHSEATSAPAGFPIEKISEVVTTLAPMLSEFQSTPAVGEDVSGSREDHRYALLCALRPYLSRDRREMIDYILRFGKIGDLIKKIK